MKTGKQSRVNRVGGKCSRFDNKLTLNQTKEVVSKRWVK